MVLAVKRPEIEPPNTPPPTNKRYYHLITHYALQLRCSAGVRVS